MAETLLLADANPTMQRVVELTCADEGLKVVSVSDGQQALDYLVAERPALALVSVTLHKLDGFEIAGLVRDRPDLQGIPVLLLAGAFETIDETRVRESGAAGVLVKPFEPGLVIKRVKELLGISKSDRGSASGTCQPNRSRAAWSRARTPARGRSCTGRLPWAPMLRRSRLPKGARIISACSARHSNHSTPSRRAGPSQVARRNHLRRRELLRRWILNVGRRRSRWQRRASMTSSRPGRKPRVRCLPSTRTGLGRTTRRA